MEKLPISQSIYKFSVKNYSNLNSIILQHIDQYNLKTLGNEKFSITKGDYALSHKKTYWPIFMKYIKNYLDEFTTDFFSGYDRENTNLKIIHYWFQQYKDEDSHPFHIHTNSDYSMVYFVELQEKSHSTVFIDHDKKQVQLDVKEGDLLLFPSLVFHSSPKNNSLTGKTILSANLNFVN